MNCLNKKKKRWNFSRWQGRLCLRRHWSECSDGCCCTQLPTIFPSPNFLFEIQNSSCLKLPTIYLRDFLFQIQNISPTNSQPSTYHLSAVHQTVNCTTFTSLIFTLMCSDIGAKMGLFLSNCLLAKIRHGSLYIPRVPLKHVLKDVNAWWGTF